jgi:methylenetetrahydrofolate reductase (NADPH)
VHPEAPDLQHDLVFTKKKVDAGASFLITQLFFDNQVYFDFVAAARRKGIDVPIIAGVIPVASFAQTRRICDLCDATIPARLESAFLAAGGDPEREFELGIAFAAQQCSELLIAGVPGIHFYALNRAPATRAVLGSLRASRPWERTRAEAAEAPA